MPPFILQPLIENAFRHGIARRAEDSLLSIAAEVDHDSLRVVVYNEGPRLAETFSIDGAQGYGLKNVRERLYTRSPAGHIELSNVGTGVQVTLVLPLWEASQVRSSS